MPPFARDPLLFVTRTIITIAMVLLLVGIAGLVIGIPAVLLHNHEILTGLAKVAKQPLVPEQAGITEAIVAAMLLGILELALMWLFLRLMREVIDSVGAGDPFAPRNAERLFRMAWVVVATQVVAIPLVTLGHWLASHVRHDIDVQFNVSGGSIILALVLFILARVFRHGAAMREELEGTV